MGQFNLMSHIRNLEIMKLTEKKLLTKKDFLENIIDSKYKNDFGQWKIKDLRDHFSLTHIINGKPVNLQGHCYKCLKPLRADYTQYENYCLDC